MIKLINCRDIGFDCEGVVRASNEQEALRKVADHAREAHGVEALPDAVRRHVRQVMQQETS